MHLMGLIMSYKKLRHIPIGSLSGISKKILFGVIFFNVSSTGVNATDFTLTSGDRASGNFNITNNGSDANGPGILDDNGSIVINYGYNGQTWNLAVNGSGQSRPYVFQQFKVDTTGNYDFGIRSSAFVDPLMIVYRGSFNPSSPNANIIAGNDDGTVASNGCGTVFGGNGTYCPQIQGANLTAGTQYYMVVTTWGTGAALTYPFTFYCNGPGVCTFIPPGPDAGNTTVALRLNADSLRGTLDRRLSGLALMTGYDCASFDKLGYCVSFQARYSNFDSMSEGAGVLTAAYRVNDQVRVGAFVDYRSSEKAPTNIKFGNDLPTFGVFAGYSQNANGVGLQGKVLAAVQKGDATVTRDNSLSSTEPGSGKGSLNAYVISGELGWGFVVAPLMITTPFVGLRYTDATRGGYTESTVAGTVDNPISYKDYSQRLTTATAGIRVMGMFTEKVGYRLSGGLEHDLRQQTSSYSGTSAISGLETFAVDITGVNNRTRGFASAGLFYQIDKAQRLTANVSMRNQAYTSQNAATVMGGYQVAF